MVKLNKIKRHYWPSEIDFEINALKRAICSISTGDTVDVSEIKKQLEDLGQTIAEQKHINDKQQHTIDNTINIGFSDIADRIQIQEQAQLLDEWEEM